jgi:hypothetical protein
LATISKDVDRAALTILGQNLAGAPLKFLVWVSCEPLHRGDDLLLPLTRRTVAKQMEHPAANIERRIVDQ